MSGATGHLFPGGLLQRKTRQGPSGDAGRYGLWGGSFLLLSQEGEAAPGLGSGFCGMNPSPWAEPEAGSGGGVGGVPGDPAC